MAHHHDIQDLLDRYWEGEATLEEERALKAYFASGEVDPRFAAEAPFFQALREERALQSPNIHLKASMTTVRPVWYQWASAAAVVGMVALAGWWAARPRLDHQPSVAATQQHQTTQLAAAQPAQPVLDSPALAAQPDSPQPKINRKPRPHRNPKPLPATQQEETLDPETQKALEEVRAALALVSSKLNKGRRTAAKNLNQVETLDKFFKHKKETDG